MVHVSVDLHLSKPIEEIAAEILSIKLPGVSSRIEHSTGVYGYNEKLSLIICASALILHGLQLSACSSSTHFRSVYAFEADENLFNSMIAQGLKLSLKPLPNSESIVSAMRVDNDFIFNTIRHTLLKYLTATLKVRA